MSMPASETGRAEVRPASAVSLQLGRGQVHLWKCFFATGADHPEWHGRLLAPDEIKRARRFVRSDDRQRFIYFHGALRVILGAYTCTPPHMLSIETNPCGKPQLVDALNAGDLRFSLSHSQDVALVAVATGREIGVDVECLRNLPEAKSIAQDFFSVEEQKIFASQPEEEFLESFFRCWTMKEAYAKGKGTGLSLPFKEFTVPFSKSGGCTMVERVYPWNFESIRPHEGYLGAIAAEGCSMIVKHFDYDENLMMNYMRDGLPAV